MSRVKYLGHKESQSSFIVSKILKYTKPSDDIVVGDLFSGTGSISSELKRKGYRVHANDSLKQCVIRAESLLCLSEAPQFKELPITEIKNSEKLTLTPSRYHQVLAHLNHLKGEEGFFYYNYSPGGSKKNNSLERRYFTDANGRKIDAIRSRVRLWKEKGYITELEHSLLLVNLIEATNEIANISGTYGCFLKSFQSNALRPFRLKPFSFVPGLTEHVVSCGDVFKAAKNTSAEIIYLDPPYTKRQYITYYHIPETIAREDEPEIEGKTGIRVWEGEESIFCYKSKALSAVQELIECLCAKEIYLSYSSDGHILKEDLIRTLNQHGDVTVWEYKQKRFKSNRSQVSNGSLHEYLFRVRCKK